MGTVSPSGPRAWARAVRAWPLFELPRWLVVFVLAVIAADAAAIAAAAMFTAVRAHDLEIFSVLLACDAATVELTRRGSDDVGLIKEVHAVWELPLALLLPPFFGLIAPIVRIALTQWRVRRALAYRRIFTAAALGLSYAAGSVTFHALAPALWGLAAQPSLRGPLWGLAIVTAGVLRSAVNKLLVMTAVKGADPATSIRTALFRRAALFDDTSELSVGVLIAYVVMVTPVAGFVALPCVVMLQRSQRHNQLVSEARIDARTSLLNDITWHREADVRVVQANRNRVGGALAVAIADLDHFKQVNDTYGHQAGDLVLAMVAETFRALLRPYDLCGRYGGEEFAFLLPDLTAAEASDIAERLRDAVEHLAVPVPGAEDGGVRITMSIGLAYLDHEHRTLDELVAGADHALYQAKADGRNRVSMVAS